MLEVQLGEVAKEKATRQKIKDFGVMMATDHGKAGEELKAVAAKNGVTLPGDLDANHKATVDKLSKLSGAEFDTAYVAEMVKDHEKDAAAFEQASKTAQNPDVKGFAAKTLPDDQIPPRENQGDRGRGQKDVGTAASDSRREACAVGSPLEAACGYLSDYCLSDLRSVPWIRMPRPSEIWSTHST
jgi:predicted outer membrane protein